MNIKHPDIVLAQAKLESGNFNSKLFRKHNNIFGMKVPQQRNNVARGAPNEYASYPNWKYSIIDYGLLQSTYYRGLTREQYFKKLSENYASDPEYVNKLKKIIDGTL